jgi:hypothetical protein
MYLKIGYSFQNNIIIPKKCKILSLTSNNKIINNIPEHVEKLHIYCFDNNTYISNLPITIKEIIINCEFHKKFIKNIPFGTLITVDKKQ